METLAGAGHGHSSVHFRVRRRHPEDLDLFLPMAARIKHADDYPLGIRSTSPQELRSFLQADGALASWVVVPVPVAGGSDAGEAFAGTDGPGAGADDVTGVTEIAGHVVLNPPRPGPVAELAQKATGLPAESLAVVARLVVSLDWRGRGLGRLLLRTAADEARRRGLRPILDTLVTNTSAQKLYDSEGWDRAGETRTTLPWGLVLHQIVYVAPAA